MNKAQASVSYALGAAILLSLIIQTGCNESPQQRIVGKWEGQIELKKSVVDQELKRVASDPEEQKIFEKRFDDMKSMKMHVQFNENGAMRMSVNVGSLNRRASGKWEIARQEGDLVVIKSTESEGAEEELRVTFEDNDSFRMDPPGPNKEIGVMRFKRLR